MVAPMQIFTSAGYRPVPTLLLGVSQFDNRNRGRLIARLPRPIF
jgi:hypothetical protein